MALAERISGSRLPTAEGVQRPNHLPRERRHSPEKDPKPQVFVASGSRRRIDFIQTALVLDEQPIALKPGIELNDQDYGIPIVVKKNNDAIKQLPPGVLDNRRATVILIASDVRPRICGVQNDVCVTKARGKPENIEAAREEVFAEMVRAARRTHTNPYYSLDIATEVVTLRGTGEVERLPMAHTTHIELDAGKIAHINSRRGYDRYYREVQAFLDSPYHLPNGDPKMTNIAGFLELMALLRMGAVAAIGETATAAEAKRSGEVEVKDRIAREDPDFPAAAQGALFDATISYIPLALKPLIPDIGQKVANYPPLQRMASYSRYEIA